MFRVKVNQTNIIWTIYNIIWLKSQVRKLLNKADKAGKIYNIHTRLG